MKTASLNPLLGGTAAAGLLLLATGCGADLGGQAPEPGTAARIGDEAISVEDVDIATDALCTVQENDPNAQATTRRSAADNIVTVWIARQAAEVSVEESGQPVEVPPFDYEAIPGWDDLSEEEQEALRDYADSSQYLNAVGQALGAEAFEPAEEVELNPLYDEVELTEDIAFGGAQLSVAVSDEAKDGGAEEPTAEQLAALPPEQVCGVVPDPAQPQVVPGT